GPRRRRRSRRAPTGRRHPPRPVRWVLYRLPADGPPPRRAHRRHRDSAGPRTAVLPQGRHAGGAGDFEDCDGGHSRPGDRLGTNRTHRARQRRADRRARAADRGGARVRRVDRVGFEGTPLPKAVTGDPRITIHRLDPATLRLRGGFKGATYAAAGLFDAARLSFRLWRILRTLPQPDLVLVQNPPHFPTILV